MPDTPRKSPVRKPAPGHGLSRKLGPLPVWGWGVGILAAVLLGVVLRRRQANQGQAGTEPAAAQDPGGGSSGGGDGGTPTPGTIDLGPLLEGQRNLEGELAQLTDALGAGLFSSDQFGADGFNPDSGSALPTVGPNPNDPYLHEPNEAAVLSAFSAIGSGFAGRIPIALGGRRPSSSFPPSVARTGRNIGSALAASERAPRARPNNSAGRTGGARPVQHPARPSFPQQVIQHPSVQVMVAREARFTPFTAPPKPQRHPSTGGGGGHAFAL